MKKNLIVALPFFLAAILIFQSCRKTPIPCFTTEPPEDSLRVNLLVTFNAVCSTHEGEFYWKFNHNDDSIEFGPEVKKIFGDTGDVNVYLLVSNGNKLSSLSRDLHINP